MTTYCQTHPDHHAQPLPNPPLREESDSLGARSLPADALYGVQTQRALENYGQLREPVSRHRQFLRAFGQIKLAYVRVTSQHWPDAHQQACVSACQQLIDGALDQAFPISCLQGGAGTATHMNVNEVLANRALQLLNQPPGAYHLLHPNDHLNIGQSTNDVYPSALRLACYALSGELVQQAVLLSDAFAERADSFGAARKLGRTQLQDAVPMTAAQECQAFASALRAAIDALQQARQPLLQLNLGGTAIGTGVNAVDSAAAYAQLRQISGLPVQPADNLVQASWDTGDWLTLAGALKRLALCQSKIASDLRLLSAGPAGGLAEYQLPARAPGSSIMPGKVNPVMAELINQIAFDCAGREHAIALAAEQGQLQLNAFLPLIAHSLFAMFSALTEGCALFRLHCISGMQVNSERTGHWLSHSAAEATAWVPKLGYSQVSKLVQQAQARGVPFMQQLEELQCQTAALLSK